MMADVNSLVALGIPSNVAAEMAGGDPDKDVLMAYGVPARLAQEIDDTPSAGSTVGKLMALGLSGLQAQEVYDVLNP